MTPQKLRPKNSRGTQRPGRSNRVVEAETILQGIEKLEIKRKLEVVEINNSLMNFTREQVEAEVIVCYNLEKISEGWGWSDTLKSYQKEAQRKKLTLEIRRSRI